MTRQERLEELINKVVDTNLAGATRTRITHGTPTVVTIFLGPMARSDQRNEVHLVHTELAKIGCRVAFV